MTRPHPCLTTLLAATAAFIGALGPTPSSAATPELAGAYAASAKLCKGKPVTITGTSGADQLIGTSGRDVIHAGGGMDGILGAGGRDLICGGGGADVLDGGRGADVLYGGGSGDQCFGEDDEHVNHHGCEAHLPSYDSSEEPHARPVNLPVPPDITAPDAAPAQAPAPAPAPAAAASTVVDLVTPRTAATSPLFYAGKPWCSSQEIRGFPVQLTGAFTTPSYVAVRPVVTYWQYPGTWSDLGYGDWSYITVPTGDGTLYPAHPLYSYAMDRNGMSHWALQAYWWNGAAWVEGRSVIINSYTWNYSAPDSQFCMT